MTDSSQSHDNIETMYRHLIKYLTSLAVVALLLSTTTACVRGDDYNDTPEENFQSLWHTIDEHYCFHDYKREAIGLDWNAVYQKYHHRLNPKMTRLQLFEVLSAMLGELKDGHVNLYCSADVGRNWTWKEDYPENLNTELRDKYLGTDYHIAAGLKYKILEDNVGYILYESFNSAIGEGNIGDCLYYLRACQGLIIDVRGNSGGQLTNAELLASHFTNQKLLVGYYCHKNGPGHGDFSKPKAEYLEPSTGYRWQKPVIVLTNRSCYSATNTFVRDMKECPNVRIVGDQTGGGSGMPFNSELPNGWAVRFSACPQLDARMQHTEFGIEPDITCALDSADIMRQKDTMIEHARTLLRQ